MSATTGRGITYPTVGDVLTPLANRFATLATTTDTAIGTAFTPVAGFKGTDAARLALGAGTVPILAEGLEWYSTDTDRKWFYDGSNWLTNEPGMYKIFPTSVVNGTVLANGDITSSVTSGSPLSLNGVFTSRFRNYKIVFDGALASAGALGIRLRVSGTDNATSNYGSSYMYNPTNTTLSTVYSVIDYFALMGLGVTQQYSIIELQAPALAEVTKLIADSTGLGGTGATSQATRMNSFFGIGTAFDGMTMISNGPSATVRAAVYGIA